MIYLKGKQAVGMMHFPNLPKRIFLMDFPPSEKSATVGINGLHRKSHWSIHSPVRSIDFQSKWWTNGTTGSGNSRQVGGHIIVLAVGTETNEAPLAPSRALAPAYDPYVVA